MQRKLLTALSVLVFSYSFAFAQQPAKLSAKESEAVANIHSTFRRAVEIAKPAVVTIGLFHDSKQQDNTGLGSGVIIDKEGYVLTNNHVVAGDDKIAVILGNGKKLEAIDVMLDPDTDLAVIKIDPAGMDLPVATLGDSDNAQVGDFVFAIGSPFGLSQTVTMGIISYKGRQTKILGQWGLENFIQTDADINKGNSGGPLINLYGEVIGINSNIYSPTGVSSGYGFAVPSNMAKHVSQELIANKTVQRGYLGVILYSNEQNNAYDGFRITKLSDMKKFTDNEILVMAENNLKQANYLKDVLNNIPENLEGVFVAKVNSGGPAAQGGMKAFDIITSYNGEKAIESSTLRQKIARTKPDTTTKFGIWRNGKEMELEITLGNRDTAIAKAEKKKAKVITKQIPELENNPFYYFEPDNTVPYSDYPYTTKPKLGIKIEKLSSFLAQKYGYTEALGQLNYVVVTGVNLGSLAENSGINEGDIILKVNGEKISDPVQLKQIIQESDLEAGINIEIKNTNGNHTITISQNTM